MKQVLPIAAMMIALSCAVPAWTAAPAFAATKTVATSTPSDVVKSFYAQLSTVMKQGDQLGFAGRYKKLQPVLEQSFNFPLMTRFAVGLVWNDASPAEQKQITQAFSQFSIATYASRFAQFDGEQFAVVDEKPTTDGKLVETTLTPKGSDPVSLNYLMRQDETGKWRIVDIYMAGAISELATRRAEFSSVIKRDGIGALVNSLGDKAKQMGSST